MNELTTITPSVPAALEALTAMEVELASAATYEAIRKVMDTAEAIKVLCRDVDAVKTRAEDVILKAYARIGEELQKVPKASGGDQRSKVPNREPSGRAATDIPKTTRSRHMKLADHKAEVPAIAQKLREQGKDATPRAVATELAHGDKKAKRKAKEKTLGERQKALPTQSFGVIYADPPWHFEAFSAETGVDRNAENHYPTMTLEAISALKVPAADDCVLFLWATVPMLPQALSVMSAWGFGYKSHFVWVKDKIGTGYWNRNRHELLLIGVRGHIPAPALGEQYESVIEAVRAAHSAKPFAFHEMIETMFPTLPRLEMFARGDAFAGWERWGQEA